MVQNVSNAVRPVPADAAHRRHHAHRQEQPPASAAVATAERDVSASLSITTKEGDTVSISASVESSVTYAAVRKGGERADAFTATEKDQFSFTVNGNLSEQELKDISRVVKTFLHDLQAMVRGQDVSIANVADGNPTTLQSVAATAETHSTLTVAAATVPGTHHQVPQPWDAPAQPLEPTPPAPNPEQSASTLRTAPRFAPLPIAVPVTVLDATTAP